jgi:LysM repeat protein
MEPQTRPRSSKTDASNAIAAVSKSARLHVCALAIFACILSACDGSTSAPATPTVLAALAATATPQPTDSPTSTPADTATATATASPRPAVVQHIVQPNQTIGAIALLYGTTVDAILKANNISDPRLVRAGQTLIIPLPTVTPTATTTPTPNATQAALPPSPTPNIYVVQGGDVLSAIAAKYDMPVDAIMAANDLKDTFIRAGQQLIIPPPTPTPTLTSTPLPSSTPTPGLSFNAPALLFPPDGAEFSANDVIVMNWTAVGVLATDQYYVLRLRAVDGKRVESVWLRTPSFRLPATWHGSQIEWDVIVLQLTKTDTDGAREGKIQSPFSVARRFAWR